MGRFAVTNVIDWFDPWQDPDNNGSAFRDQPSDILFKTNVLQLSQATSWLQIRASMCRFALEPDACLPRLFHSRGSERPTTVLRSPWNIA